MEHWRQISHAPSSRPSPRPDLSQQRLDSLALPDPRARVGPRRRNAELLGEGVFDGLELAGLGMQPLRPPSVPTLPGVRISGEEGKRGTVGVNKIEDIRRRARAGEPVASIARHVGVSEPTVRKHARMADLSPEPPSVRRLESEVLAPLRED